MNKEPNFKKLIWQIPAFMLLLIAMGNLIMLSVAKLEYITPQMVIHGSINSVLIGGSFMFGIKWMI